MLSETVDIIRGKDRGNLDKLVVEQESAVINAGVKTGNREKHEDLVKCKSCLPSPNSPHPFPTTSLSPSSAFTCLNSHAITFMQLN